MSNNNPANEVGKPVEERKRVPMTVPMRKLEIDEVPGYKFYWMRGTAQRLAQAERAGYEFVQEHEVTLNNTDLGGDGSMGGNSDLGTRVSIVTGEGGDDGQPTRLYLMKIREEWWKEGQEVLADRSEAIAATFRRGFIGADKDAPGDAQHRYVKGKVPDLFRPKRRT